MDHTDKQRTGFASADVQVDAALLATQPPAHYGTRKTRRLLNTVDRTGKVLNLFTSEAPVWGISEISQVLQIPRSTAYIGRPR